MQTLIPDSRLEYPAFRRPNVKPVGRFKVDRSSSISKGLIYDDNEDRERFSSVSKSTEVNIDSQRVSIFDGSAADGVYFPQSNGMFKNQSFTVFMRLNLLNTNVIGYVMTVGGRFNIGVSYQFLSALPGNQLGISWNDGGLRSLKFNNYRADGTVENFAIQAKFGSNGFIRTWQNGEIIEENTSNVASILYLGGGDNYICGTGTSTFPLDFELHAFKYWNRTLSDDEIRILSRDAYAMEIPA